MAPARAMQTCRELTLRSTSNGPRTASSATAAPARHNARHGPASLTHFYARCLVLSLIKIELLRGSLFRYMPPRQSRATGQVSHVVRTQLKAPAQKNSAPQDSYHLRRTENDPLSSVPNGSAELAPLDGKEGAGGVTSCGNVARHRKQTRSKRSKPQAYPLRNRLRKRF